MAYIPPLNGGRINASIGGNSTSAGAGYNLISTGTMLLVGGNNITLSQNGASISIVGGAGGSGIAISNSQTVYNTGTVKLMEGGGAITIASTTGQQFNFSVPATSSLSATGAVSLSSNGSTISIGAPAFSAGISSNSTVSNQLILAGGNNITLSQSTNAAGATVSINGATDYLTNINVSASGGSANLSNLSFNNANGITFGYNASVITASHNGLTTARASTDGIGLNTAQTNVTWTVNSAGLSLNAAGYAGTGFSGTNASATLNSNGLSLSVGAGGGIALSGGGTSYSNGTINLSAVAGAALTISGSTNSVLSLSVPGVSSLVGTGGVSLSSNGSTISIGAPALGTLSRWEHPSDVFAPLNTAVSNSVLSVQPMFVPSYVSGSAMKIGASMSVGTFTAATTASVDISLWMGIYSLNGSTLSLASSGSANNGYTWRNTANSSQYASSYMGMRQLTVPMDINMTPGQYWVAAAIGTATTVTAMPAMTLYGNTLMNNAAGGQVLSPMGANTTAASNVRDAVLFEGVYTANTAAGPSTIVSGQINNTSASAVQLANFYNVIYNATY